MDTLDSQQEIGLSGKWEALGGVREKWCPGGGAEIQRAFEIVSVRLCRSNKPPQTLRLHGSCGSAEALLDS